MLSECRLIDARSALSHPAFSHYICAVAAQAFATLGGTAVAVLAALRDAADADATADWIGVAVGFCIGGLLGWLACPVYSITIVQASTADSDANGSMDSSCDVLLPIIEDARPMAHRANVVVGCSAVLYATIGVWLAIQ